MNIIVFSHERLNNSNNGNPRYKLFTNEGQFLTSSDHAFVSGMWDGWTREHNQTGREAEIGLTRAGRIESFKWVD